jgi:SAM-dependent methyltransferase
MVVSASGEERQAAPGGIAETRSSAVVWHELECGSYRVDLPLWRELAAQAGTGDGAQPLLDVGAGSGRVALELASRGHLVTALDRDPELLEALCERAGSTLVETVCADARTFALERRDFAVCVVPMQTIQLLSGADGRLAFLRSAREHLQPGGLLACAIVTDIQAFDCAAGDIGPEPDVVHRDGLDYVSRPTALRVSATSIRIERERRILSRAHRAGRRGTPRDDEPELDAIELDRLTAAQLRAEGEQAGLRSDGTRSIPPTLEHVGSEVVLLRA